MGSFIQNQILGMKWLNVLIGNLLSAMGLDTTSRIGGSVQFFISNHPICPFETGWYMQRIRSCPP